MSTTRLPAKVKVLLAAHTASIAGLGAQVVVLALVALERYGSPAALAVLVVARAVGLLAGFPFAGWVIARFGALRVAAATHLVFAGWAVSLGALALSTAPAWTLAAVTAVAGFAMAADSPARRAGIADLAGGGTPAAMSWLTSSTWAGRLVGAALGAACWAVAPWAAFAANAATYLVPAALFARWAHHSPAAADPPARPQPVRTLVALTHHRRSARVLAATAVGGVAVEFGVVAALVSAAHGTGAAGLSVAEALCAAGAVIAGAAGARLRPQEHTRSVAAGWVAAAAGAVMVAAPWFWVAAVGLAVASGGVTYASARSTTVLVGVGDHLRGDALAAFGVLQWGSSAVAAPLLVVAAGVGTWALAALSVAAMGAAAWVAVTANPEPLAAARPAT